MPKKNSRQLRKLKNNNKLLTKMGYRRISNSSCTVARVDSSDWQNSIMEVNPTLLLGVDGGADHYRRNFSQDRIKLQPSVYKLIPGSQNDPVGFITEDWEDVCSKVVLLAPDEVVVKLGTNHTPEIDCTQNKGFLGWLLNLLK